MPNGIEDISKTLERGYILRKFNKTILEMEDSTGSLLNRVIGVGTKVDKETGQTIPVTHTYPSYFSPLVEAFELFPITKYFGLTPQTAMELPVNQWYEIRDKAIKLAIKDQNKTEGSENQMLQFMKEFMTARNNTPSE